MPSKNTYVGRAFCSVDSSNPEFDEGMRGAFVVIVCSADNILEATKITMSELAENALTIRGFEYFFDTNYVDRELSNYEIGLIARLGSYPVQFENIHYFKPDS